MARVTFTLDEATADQLNRVAKRRSITKSQALGEAIDEYYAKVYQLGESERQHLVKITTDGNRSLPIDKPR